MREQVSRKTLQVFNDTEKRSDHDQSTSDEESHEVFAPGSITLSARGWYLFHGEVKVDGYGDKAAKEEDLHEKPTNDNVLARVEGAFGACRLDATTWNTVVS